METTDYEEDLVAKLVSLTGLPEEMVESEISAILAESGHSRKELTLEQLRTVMIKYLESVNEAVLQRNS